MKIGGSRSVGSHLSSWIESLTIDGRGCLTRLKGRWGDLTSKHLGVECFLSRLDRDDITVQSLVRDDETCCCCPSWLFHAPVRSQPLLYPTLLSKRVRVPPPIGVLSSIRCGVYLCLGSTIVDLGWQSAQTEPSKQVGASASSPGALRPVLPTACGRRQIDQTKKPRSGAQRYDHITTTGLGLLCRSERGLLDP